jgi:phosphoribosyl 1,2-cyclic phosphodiesterase
MPPPASDTPASTTAPGARTRLWTLGSGSRGNAVVVGHRPPAPDAAERLLMLDAGFELPELVARLRAAGLHPWDVEDVVLTHGHRDHVLGAAAGARAYGWRLWGTLGTVWRWRALREVPLQGFAPGDRFTAGAFTVHSTPVPHDVDDASAFLVEPPDGTRVGYATDLGEVPAALAALFRDADALVLEANHDPALLAAGPYPPEVKTRVAGPTGHLSNAQAAALARAVAHPGLGHLLLAHVSRHNNTPLLALETIAAALQGTRFAGTLAIAAQDEVTGPMLVGRR